MRRRRLMLFAMCIGCSSIITYSLIISCCTLLTTQLPAAKDLALDVAKGPDSVDVPPWVGRNGNGPLYYNRRSINGLQDGERGEAMDVEQKATGGDSVSADKDSSYYDGENVVYDDEEDEERNGYLRHKWKPQQNATKRLPQALIIGVKKGGTRAVLEFLRLHPDVRAPGPEPHFFDRHYHNGLDWYRNLMPSSVDGKLTIEKTPSYFITKEVPKRVYNFSKNVKLIVVVRDPVTRAVSDYTQVVSKKPEVKTFEQMVFLDNTSRIVDTLWSPVRIGVYAKHLERWLQFFPLRQIHFVSGELLIKNPVSEMAKVQDFLGLNRFVDERHFYLKSTKGFPCIIKPGKNGHPHCLDETKGRQHPSIDPQVIKRLRNFYRPFNAKFYQMVHRDFGWS